MGHSQSFPEFYCWCGTEISNITGVSVQAFLMEALEEIPIHKIDESKLCKGYSLVFLPEPVAMPTHARMCNKPTAHI